MRYNADGSQAWVHRYGSGHTSVSPAALGLDPAGNILLAGDGFTEAVKYLLVKLDKNRNTAWIRYYPPLDTFGYCEDMAVDGSGSSTLTGYTRNPMTCRTVQYDGNGELVWQAKFRGFGTQSVAAGSAVATDALGFVYVVGTVTDSGQYSDVIVIKYSLTGDTLWVRQYNGPGGRADEAVAVAVGADGSVFVLGTSAPDPSYPRRADILTLKYSAEGTLQWASSHRSSFSKDR